MFRSRCSIPSNAGTLEVQEDRSRPGTTIRVAYGRITPAGSSHDDPVLVVGGDLGVAPAYGGIARSLVGWVETSSSWRVGESAVPSRRSPARKWTSSLPRCCALAITIPEVRRLFRAAVEDCHSRIVAEGVDPQAYTLEAMAADAVELRQALGRRPVERGQLRNVVRNRARARPPRPGGSPRPPARLTGGARPRTPFGRRAPHAARASPVLADCGNEQRSSAPSRASGRHSSGRCPSSTAIPEMLRMSGLGTGGNAGQRVCSTAPCWRARSARCSPDVAARARCGRLRRYLAVLDLVSRGRVADLGPTLAELVAGEQPFCLGYQPKCESTT